MDKPIIKALTALLMLWVLTSCEYESSTPLPTTSMRLSPSPVATWSPVVSPTQTEAPTITPSPQPTLTKEEVQEVIGELLAKNGSCTEPCFWGFSPTAGIKESQLLNFLTYIREKPKIIKESKYTQYIASIGYKERISVSATFTFDEKTHSLLNIYATIGGLYYYPEIVYADWDAFRPDNILRIYGRPSSVEFFLSYPAEPTTDQTIGYEFRFRYESRKFVIDYTGQRTLNQTKLFICPLKDRFIESVYVYLGDNLKIKPTNGKFLQDVSSVSIDDFYNAMTGNANNACFYLDRSAFGN
ncbi:MAG: hypothetical protein ACOYYI_09385 [Chloroflexota bacterium]